MTQPPHRRRALFSGVVVLQTAVLLASMIMVPSSVLAQDPSAPGSQQEAQPSGEADPEPSQTPAPDPSAKPGSEPSVEPGPEPSATPEATPDASPSPAPVESVAPSSSPDGSPSASPGTSASVAPEPSPSHAVDSPPPTAPAASPAGTGRNSVTVRAAADIDRNGKLDDLVTIESPPGTILRNVHAVPIPRIPRRPPASSFPQGCSTTKSWSRSQAIQPPSRSISRMARSGRTFDTGFWVLQNGRWSDLTARADADHVTDEVTVKLVDGGAGDEDRSADGVIQDPGGPGVPGDDWSLTITLRATADPTATFNFFLEECTETTGTTGCTPQAPRQWVDWVAVDGPTLPGTAITPVTLSDGQSFTWANLDADRHYRVIEVGTASPPDTGTGSAPVGWAVTASPANPRAPPCSSQKTTTLIGFLSTVDGELVPSPGWSDLHRRQQPDRRSSRGQHHHGPQGGRPLGHPHEPAAPGRHDGPLARPQRRRQLPARRRRRGGLHDMRDRGERSLRLHRIGRGCLLGPGGVSARRWDLECHHRMGSGFELGGEPSPCRTRPSGMETPPQPSASRVPTTRTASRSSWTAAPAT